MPAHLIPTDAKTAFRGFAEHLKSLGCKNSDIAFALSVSERQIEAWLWDAGKEPDDAAIFLMHQFCRFMLDDKTSFPKNVSDDIRRLAIRKIRRVHRMGYRLKSGKPPIGTPGEKLSDDDVNRGRKSKIHQSERYGQITAKQAAELSGVAYHTITARLRSGKTIDEAIKAGS